MKLNRWLCSAALTAAVTLAALPGVVRAQVAPLFPFGSLSFIAPTGSVTNTEIIDVWVRFQMDAASPALVFSSNPFVSNLDSSFIPTQGYYYPPAPDPRELRDFANIDGAYLSVYVGCTGSFIGDCSPGSTDYQFDFYYGPGSVVGQPSANIAPGGTLDYKLGSFTPKPGGAAPGNYSFGITGLTLAFFGVDAANNALFSDGVTLGSECAGCSFSREVTAVPEPAGWALMLAGLAGLALAARRMSNRRPGG